jgi:hypothetical protein
MAEERSGLVGQMPSELIEIFDSLDGSLRLLTFSSPPMAELSVAHHYLASTHTLAALTAAGGLTKAREAGVIEAMLGNARLAKRSADQQNWRAVLTHARAALVSMPEGDPGWYPEKILPVPDFAPAAAEDKYAELARLASSLEAPLRSASLPAPPGAIRAIRRLPRSVSAMPGEGGHIPPKPLDVPE